jgi:hypothetical protein
MALHRDDRRALLDHKLTELLLYAKELWASFKFQLTVLRKPLVVVGW